MRIINPNKIEMGVKNTWREKKPKILEIRGKHFIFDENSMVVTEIEKEFVDKIDASSLCVDSAPFFEISGEPQRKGYIVFQATYACNLACQYCFVKHHYADHTNTIDLQTCIDALKHYQPDFKQAGANVGWFGGEPLLNWEGIVQFVEWLRKNISKEIFAKSSFHITTNGTLLTEEIAEYLAQNHFSLIISLDGNEEDHNNARPYAKGNTNNSWKDTMRGIDFVYNAFKKAKMPNPVTLRSTFDRNGCDLVERLKLLNKLMYEGKSGHVSVEPSCLAESCARETFEGLQEEEIRAKFQIEYYKAADWYLGELSAGRKPSFHHFEVPLQRLIDRQMAITECGAGKGYVSVGPGGKIAACHREHESVIGNMYTGIDKAKQASWYDNRYYNRIGCNECWQRNICGGGCRCNSALLYKNLWQPSKVECIFREMQNLAVIWLLSEMSESEMKKFSKQRNNNELVKRGNEANETEKPCSDPNNCEPCKCKLQEQNKDKQVEVKSTEKQTPICGLKACEGDNCPFSHCGKQTPEDFQAGLKKLNKG